MKTICVSLVILFISFPLKSQSISISPDGSPPDSSAMLDIRSQDKGLLVPRTETSQVIAPAKGLIIYDTLDAHFMLFDGMEWTRLLKESDFSYYFADRDGDTYGDKYAGIYAQSALPGYVEDSLDCNDLDSLISPASTEICDSIDNNCDGVIDEGDLCPAFEVCELGTCVNCCSNNGGASCAGPTILNTICGENGNGGPINVNGCGEAWYRFTLEECDGTNVIDLQISISLFVPNAMDYDLYLYAPCATQVASSTNSGSVNEQIQYTVIDNFLNDNTTVFYVKVDLWSGGECDHWTLTIVGG